MLNKTARNSYVQISIEGKNVTGDLAPYLLGFTFNDKTSVEVDDLTITLDDRDELFTNEWMPERGDKIEATIWANDWDAQGDKDSLYCGEFEIDLVVESGPPNKIEIKAVSSLNSGIRRTIYTEKWEHTTLKEVCESIAETHGMQLKFSGDDVDLEVCDQTETTDLKFLSQLADDNDFMLKLDGDTLFVLSQVELECAAPTLIISKHDISNRNAGAKGYDLYKECKATYYDPNKKKTQTAKVNHKAASMAELAKTNQEWVQAHTVVKKGKAKAKNVPTTTESYLDKANVNGGGKVLHIRQRFKNAAEAERKALAALRRKNRGEWVISGEVMGNVELMAGITVEIVDYGRYSGRYYIESTTHAKTTGYRTSFVAHRCLGKIEE